MRAALALTITALLSGCIAVEEAPSDGDSAQNGESRAPDGDGSAREGEARGSANGIEVEVVWGRCAEAVCANATATNRGSETVQISSICVAPWDERMARDGQAVQHREPQVSCAAYGRKAFAPGDRARAEFSWDGTVHEGDEARPAPPGIYTWTIVFWWDDAQGGLRQEATADVRLVVGP